MKHVIAIACGFGIVWGAVMLGVLARATNDCRTRHPDVYLSTTININLVTTCRFLEGAFVRSEVTP